MGKSGNFISRRRFLANGVRGTIVVATSSRTLSPGRTFDPKPPYPEVQVEDPDGALGRTHAPVCVQLRLENRFSKALNEGRLQVREITSRGKESQESAVQCVEKMEDGTLRLCWQMPVGTGTCRTFVFEEAKKPRPDRARVHARQRPDGQFEIEDEARHVLCYNYAEVGPGDVLISISADNRKYAVPRSDYIHPLHGPSGEIFTKDWSVDHPHHRGIYWAWPEVDWRGKRGDLHALQNVFARPIGRVEMVNGGVFAQVCARNTWNWEGGEPIVGERIVIRAYRADGDWRVVDFEFRFHALNDPVLVARRGATHYGGLNIRLSAVKDQQITKAMDTPGTQPRRAWADLSGTFAGAPAASGLTIIQHASNPDYPGDWIEYPELNWLQPAFPASGTLYELSKRKSLVLRYRLVTHTGGSLSQAAGQDFWQAAHSRSSPML